MDTTILPVSNCSGCGTKLDAATAVDAVPKHGDFSVCIECGTLHRFDAELRLIAATEEETELLGPKGKMQLDSFRKTIHDIWRPRSANA
jgi:hypothetical protein